MSPQGRGRGSKPVFGCGCAVLMLIIILAVIAYLQTGEQPCIMQKCF